MILLAVLIVVLAAILEARSLRDGLDSIREDFGPETTLVDPDETFRLTVSVRNAGPRHILFLRLTEALPPEIRPRSEEHVVRTSLGDSQIAVTTWLRPWRSARFDVPVRALIHI